MRHQLLLQPLLIALILCVMSASARSRKERDRKKDKVKAVQKDANLCKMEGNSGALQCVCVGGTPPHNTTSAECWVFTGVTKDHGVWGLFATQPHITDLNFFVRPQEQFTFIPTKGLRHLNFLKKLEIKYANISEIHPYAFANSTSLTELTLTRNQIMFLDHHAFAHLTNLTELDLEENRISEFRRDVFVDLPKLRQLFAKRNNLSVIQEEAFRHLAHLLELELDNNYLNVLTRDTFAGLGELRTLDLSRNSIEMLGDLTFSELWVLEELHLEHNNIVFISGRAFAGLNHLRKLFISHNKLKLLSPDLLGGVNTIIDLDLRFNQLETLTFNNVQPIIQNLRNETGYFYIGGIQGLCIYLRRLAYPNRLIELEPLFALSPQSLSDIANTVMCIIYQNYGHLLQNLHNLDWLNYNKLQQCAEAVANKGAPVQNCWGFIDGTARSICRPSVDQENYYSGHKRHHCVKYQSVICPDGIVVHLSDAYPGRRHDAGILRETNFYAQLEQQATFPNEDFFTIYGDQAYGIRRLLLCPYGNRNLTPEQQNFNQAMSSVRQAVEWGFGKTIAEFAFLDYKKNQKLLLQDISKMYATATILSNCHTCLYGSQTSQYFNINPPMLEEYLGIL